MYETSKVISHIIKSTKETKDIVREVKGMVILGDP